MAVEKEFSETEEGKKLIDKVRWSRPYDAGCAVFVANESFKVGQEQQRENDSPEFIRKWNQSRKKTLEEIRQEESKLKEETIYGKTRRLELAFAIVENRINREALKAMEPARGDHIEH